MSDFVDGDPFDPVYIADLVQNEVAATGKDVDEAEVIVRERMLAYRAVFKGVDPAALDIVMSDLARFCRAHTSTFHENPVHAGRLDGRREVYMRIIDHTRLDYDALYVKYTNKGV